MSKQIILKDIICNHNIPITGRYGAIHIIIFYDPKTHNTWYWRTQTTDGLRYEEHNTYSIIANDDGNYKLSRVNEVSFDRSKSSETKSEQLDALDVLLGLAEYKNC